MDKISFEKARGMYFWDSQGRKYLDFTSGGIFAAVLGANNPELKKAARETKLQCCYGNHYDNPYSDLLKGRLKDITGYESVCLFSTGSEATEAFWRACRVYTGKAYVWGGLIDPDQVGQDKPDPPADSMHGWTLGAMIMAGKTFNPVRLGGVEEIGKAMFGQDQALTGAAIWEPYHAPSAQFHKEQPTIARIRDNMRTFKDIHFCCDEVQGGLGRTGKLFAHEWYPEVRPEFVCLGKALGGGYPLSALLGPKAILEDRLIIENAALHSTHSGHPVMAHIGCTVLAEIIEMELINRSFVLGRILADELKDCGLRVHAGRGLLAGLETQGPIMTQKIVEACQRRGLLVVDTGRKWVKVGPAFIISEKELIKGCKILKQAIEEVQDEIAACGDQGEGSGHGDRDVSQPGVPGNGADRTPENGQAEGSGGPIDRAV